MITVQKNEKTDTSTRYSIANINIRFNAGMTVRESDRSARYSISDISISVDGATKTPLDSKICNHIRRKIFDKLDREFADFILEGSILQSGLKKSGLKKHAGADRMGAFVVCPPS